MVVVLEQFNRDLIYAEIRMIMLLQEVNNVIEDSCQQAVTNLPRYCSTWLQQ